MPINVINISLLHNDSATIKEAIYIIKWFVLGNSDPVGFSNLRLSESTSEVRRVSFAKVN
jgi:hypothetical protein